MIIKIERNKKKTKMQFSKKLTIIILLAITISWARGLVLYWNELDYFNYILDYTQTIGLGILPYFLLSATDRLVYMQEAKNKGEKL